MTLPRAGLFTVSLVTFGAFVSCAASGRLPCAGVSSPDLSISDSALVSESDWNGLVDCLNRTGFWTEHTRGVQLGVDGEHPVVEAVIGGRYNVIMHGSFSCPPEPAFFECVSRAAVLARPSMRKVNATQNEWYDRCEKGR